MKDYNLYSDQQLAALLRSGDDAAFHLIYIRYWKKLLAVATNRLGDFNQAEELMQDIFMNLWLRREDFTLKLGFDNYFAVAVKFQVINRRAKRARESERNKGFAAASTELSPAIDNRFDLEFLQAQLEEAVNALPKKCQLVFRMSREQELSNKEIAAELNISEKGVEKHMTSALKVLRTRFGNWLPLLLLLVK